MSKIWVEKDVVHRIYVDEQQIYGAVWFVESINKYIGENYPLVGSRYVPPIRGTFDSLDEAKDAVERAVLESEIR